MGSARPLGLWTGLLALALWVCCATAQAQDGTTAPLGPAVLVADDIQITSDRRLIATGNVEAFQGQTRLTASAIAYDPNTGALTLTGPITIDDGAGVILLADQAELSADLQNGLLLGARLVLNEQLQLAAVQANRVNGRYTQLYKTVVSSCRICADDPRPPLWQIRAKRVVHDEIGQQLYFDDAQLRIRSIPILYLPRLRVPDPTQTRATGFLIPEVRSDSRLGTGIRVPYFIKLNAHRDLTLTPYLSNNTRTLEFRYREAFARGGIEFRGALSKDDLKPDDSRGYLLAGGRFDLKKGFRLEFDIEAVSDDAYLSDYDYFARDRLDSQVQISRTRRDAFVRLSYINHKSLRDDEDDDVLPSDVVEALYERRLFPRALGGEVRLAAAAHSHRRASNVDVDTNMDGVVDGRDALRLNIEAEWLRTFQMGGLQAQTRLGLVGGTYQITDDAVAPSNESELSPTAALTLRYPLMKQGNGTVRHVVEPIMQVGWVGGDGLSIPNDESTRVEFDEGNLLTLSRFPSQDRRERGLVVALGGTWYRTDPNGWSLSVTGAQILRQDAQADLSVSSGLSGTDSDFLFGGQLKLRGGFAVTGRTLFDKGFDITKAEFRGDWSNTRVDVGSSFIWIDEDPAIDLVNPIGEITFDGAYRIDRFWSASFDMRYDFQEGRAATAAAGLAYENECVRVGVTVNRSFADSTTIEPSTSLGLTVSLRGFSADTGAGVETRSCGKQAK